MLSSLNLNFYYDGDYDSKIVAIDGKIQLRSGYHGDEGFVWWYDNYEKEWRQITTHYFDLKDARKEYYWYAERQYK